jgi:hypothetical protein
MTLGNQLVECASLGLHVLIFETLRRVRPPPARVPDPGAGTGDCVVKRWWEQFLASGLRWPFRLVASLLDSLLRDPGGGNIHIYVLAEDQRS